MTAAAFKNISQYQSAAHSRIVSAVERAAARTGVDFSFLMKKAETESNLNPKAQAATSSARGLFQFIETTWLSMVKQHGDRFGLGALADKIELRDGKPCVDDCALREKILALREDPEVSALMAGAYSAGNKEYLARHTKGDVSGTDLYLAHFLGAGGAGRFINARDAAPDAIAADKFPEAARANKNIFFDKATGQARSLDEVYALFARKFAGVGDSQITNSDRAAPPSSPLPDGRSSTPPSAVGIRLVRAPAATPALTGARAQAHPFSVRDNAHETTRGNAHETARESTHETWSLPALSRLSPATLMMLLETSGDLPFAPTAQSL